MSHDTTGMSRDALTGHVSVALFPVLCIHNVTLKQTRMLTDANVSQSFVLLVFVGFVLIERLLSFDLSEKRFSIFLPGFCNNNLAISCMWVLIISINDRVQDSLAI